MLSYDQERGKTQSGFFQGHMPLVPPHGRNQNVYQGEKYDEETIFKRSDSVGLVPDAAAHGIAGGGNSAQQRNACRDRTEIR